MMSYETGVTLPLSKHSTPQTYYNLIRILFFFSHDRCQTTKKSTAIRSWEKTDGSKRAKGEAAESAAQILSSAQQLHLYLPSAKTHS